MTENATTKSDTGDANEEIELPDLIPSDVPLPNDAVVTIFGLRPMKSTF